MTKGKEPNQTGFTIKVSKSVEKNNFGNIVEELITEKGKRIGSKIFSSVSTVKFHISDDKTKLHVYNATRVIKILNSRGKLILIQTAPKNGEPAVFDIQKLKRGATYFIEASDEQLTFIKP
ncbi:hypothetical protein A9P82_00720 [Arachidicoccus ginsenosidimutans]|uniref:response regulator transcription factor n=1 Tax=Arachidicoccus sp. BS20 TaxID=1850526 RepID=UPI0007F12B0C|nr:response regulator transcription factor [Arachidicoccus sp. BS20]ANI87966.1 hypothetical protein A9P82_00720 [Arachidicoccus sp. BS20]